MLVKHRAAFGMQLRKVNYKHEPVKSFMSGLPEHQPRRPIRHPRFRDARIMWEDAGKERGMIRPLSCTDPDSIHSECANTECRDNSRFISVPRPEALERFRGNQWFSTF